MNYIDMSDKLIAPNVSGEEAINNSIKNILGCTKGTMPGNPSFGCNINKFLFGQIDKLTMQLIREEIIYSLKVWEVRIEVVEVVVSDNLDYNNITIKIKFLIKEEVENPEREFIFSLNV